MGSLQTPFKIEPMAGKMAQQIKVPVVKSDNPQDPYGGRRELTCLVVL